MKHELDIYFTGNLLNTWLYRKAHNLKATGQPFTMTWTLIPHFSIYKTIDIMTSFQFNVVKHLVSKERKENMHKISVHLLIPIKCTNYLQFWIATYLYLKWTKNSRMLCTKYSPINKTCPSLFSSVGKKSWYCENTPNIVGRS